MPFFIRHLSESINTFQKVNSLLCFYQCFLKVCFNFKAAEKQSVHVKDHFLNFLMDLDDWLTNASLWSHATSQAPLLALTLHLTLNRQWQADSGLHLISGPKINKIILFRIIFILHASRNISSVKIQQWHLKIPLGYQRQHPKSWEASSKWVYTRWN